MLRRRRPRRDRGVAAIRGHLGSRCGAAARGRQRRWARSAAGHMRAYGRAGRGLWHHHGARTSRSTCAASSRSRRCRQRACRCRERNAHARSDAGARRRRPRGARGRCRRHQPRARPSERRRSTPHGRSRHPIHGGGVRVLRRPPREPAEDRQAGSGQGRCRRRRQHAVGWCRRGRRCCFNRPCGQRAGRVLSAISGLPSCAAPSRSAARVGQQEQRGRCLGRLRTPGDGARSR